MKFGRQQRKFKLDITTTLNLSKLIQEATTSSLLDASRTEAKEIFQASMMEKPQELKELIVWQELGSLVSNTLATNMEESAGTETSLETTAKFPMSSAT